MSAFGGEAVLERKLLQQRQRPMRRASITMSATLVTKRGGQHDFDEFVTVISGTDRVGVPKRMIEVIHGS